ncbi:LysR substrate-binding domain-containing protein, partial [Citrobacter cronae]|uniref:LysR substrate-binding domain-containing protein n=2 Tax=Gammaproteobacteria TaxID=1236 RepID=UPI00211E5EA0
CAPSLLSGPLPLQQLQDLTRHMLLHPSRDEHDWRLWLQAAGAGFEPQGPKQHFETLDMAMAMASQGTGIAIGDWALIGDDLRSGRLCMPFGLKVTTGKGYYLVSPSKTMAAGLVELLEWLQERARH